MPLRWDQVHDIRTKLYRDWLMHSQTAWSSHKPIFTFFKIRDVGLFNCVCSENDGAFSTKITTFS
jgi:hypothetical protein